VQRATSALHGQTVDGLRRYRSMRIDADVSSRIACRDSESSPLESSPPIRPFRGARQKSHLYSLNKCSAEDPNEIPFCRLAYP
jgi:hypothetical protein